MAIGKIDARIDKPDQNNEVVLLADHILTKLAALEHEHPYLTENPAYLSFKLVILEERAEPSEDANFLKGIYAEMMTSLGTISVQRNTLAVIGNGKHLHLPRFLPATFEELMANFRHIRGPEVIEDGIESLAEEILFGDYEGGIGGVDSYVPQIKARVLKLLIYDDGEKRAIQDSIREFGEAETFRLLHLKDEALETIIATENIENPDESIIATIAHVILAARDQIHHENGRPTFMTQVEDETGLDEIGNAIVRAGAQSRGKRHLRLL